MTQEGQDDVAALAERMMKASAAKKLDVTWFGGEPLLMPDVIEALSRYLLVTVEPSLRWRETAPEQTGSMEEWLQFLLDFLDWRYENDIDLALDVWSYWTGSKGSRRVTIVRDLFSRGAHPGPARPRQHDGYRPENVLVH